MELTKSEIQIMDALWGSPEPLSRADLLAQNDGAVWKDSSVHILLNGLLSKGAIREAGSVKRGKTYGRLFAPTVSREEYYAQWLLSRRVQPDMGKLLAALCQRSDDAAQAIRNYKP